MRQGITGLIAGLVIGMVLTGGAALATGRTMPAPPSLGLTVAPRSESPIVNTKSVNPTSSVEATQGRDVRPPVAAGKKSDTRNAAKTRNPKHAGDRKSRSSQSTRRRSGVDGRTVMPRGSACAPTHVADHEFSGDDPGSGKHEMGTQHDGPGHE